MIRDFTGYAGAPPHADWPGGARLALTFAINIEEGSEANVLDGDPAAEAGLSEVPAGRVPPGARDLAVESVYEYGARVGFFRLHDLFAERGLPYTAFACALALERAPAIARTIAEADVDICAHGLRWENHALMDEATERARIAEALARIEAATGKAAHGWYCRYAPSPNTRRLLAERDDVAYDSDSYADDLPYWVRVGETDRLVVPYALDTNDAQFKTPAGFGTGADFHAYLSDAVAMLRREGERAPKMLSVGLHCRLAGRPGRAEGLARFLDAVQAMPDVWICKRIDIARHWIARHPPGRKTP